MTICCDYPDEGAIRRFLEAESYSITDTGYTEKVKLKVLGPEEKAEGLMARIKDMTGGKAVCEAGESVYY